MHVAIILAAVVVLPSPEEFQVKPQEALPVEIVNIEDVSKRVAMSKEAPEEKPVEKPAPKVAKPQPKPEPKPAREPEKAQPEPKPEPRPEPKPEPKPREKAEPAPDPLKLKELVEKVAEPEPEPKAKAAPAPRPRARPRNIRKLAALRKKQREEKKKPKKNTIDEIAALLNKVDEERKATPPKSDVTGAPQRSPADMAGDDMALSADMIDALRQKIESCWNVPAGVRDAAGLRVRIRFQMTPDGMISGGPEVLNSMAHPAFPAAARSGVRAVLECQPYDFLPPDKYEAWKDIILNFDPSRMLAVN